MNHLDISHTIDDKIVADSIAGISLENPSAKKLVIGGGIAVQSFIPAHYHRFTSDLDIEVREPLNPETYRQLMQQAFEYLRSLGYEVEGPKKERQTLTTLVKDIKNILELQTQRRTKNNAEKNSCRIGREIDSAVRKKIGVVECSVLRPEDLVLRKLLRVMRYAKEYDFSPLPHTGNVDDYFRYIRDLREHNLRNFDNLAPEEVIHLRMQADLFDIVALAVYTELDKDYLQKAFGDYDIFKIDERRTKRLFSLVHPSLDLD